MVEISCPRPNGFRLCLLPTGLYMDPQTSVYTDIRRRCIAGVGLLLCMTVAGLRLVLIIFKIYVSERTDWSSMCMYKYILS
jgi:hypothetical protein